MRVGLVGCGVVGRTLGVRLLRACHDLAVHDVERGHAAPLLERGARWAPTPASLGADRELTITALPGPDDSTAALLGEDGLWAEAPRGVIHVETSTVGPDCARRLAGEARSREIGFLDGPISRGALTESGARLTMWVAGNADTYDRARPVLDGLVDEITFCGGVGSGQVTKLVNNLVTQSLAVLLGEALTLGVCGGVPLEVLRSALHRGTAQNRLLDEMLPFSAFQGDWKPGLRVDLALKDLRLATELARSQGVDTALADVALARYAEAMERGWEGISAHAVLRLAEERAGVELRSALPDELPGGDEDPEPSSRFG